MNSNNEKPSESKVDSWIQSWNPYNPERVSAKEMEPVTIQESKIRKRAARWFFIAFAIFLIWAFFAPIDQGVTTTGQVVVSGYRKAIQHPTGGVVREISVPFETNSQTLSTECVLFMSSCTCWKQTL